MIAALLMRLLVHVLEASRAGESRNLCIADLPGVRSGSRMRHGIPANTGPKLNPRC